MSKIGYKSIPVPAGVQVTIADRSVSIKGQKGEMQYSLPVTISVKQDNGQLFVERSNEQNDVKALHGLYRSLLANGVNGVDKMWQKRLEVVGTGFNVKLQGEDLVFKIGFSHPVTFKKVSGITYQVEGNNKVVVSGVDKQLVGQVAFQIKSIKKPDVYKGKGIRYEGEKVRIKPGKKAKTA